MTHVDAETWLDRFMKRYGADKTRALKNEYERLKSCMFSPVLENKIDATGETWQGDIPWQPWLSIEVFIGISNEDGVLVNECSGSAGKTTV